jgi:hypothetical protein
VGVAGAVQGNKEAFVQQRIGVAEILEAKWRTVRGKSGVSRRDLLARSEWRGRTAERGVGIGRKSMSTAGGKIGACVGDSGLLAVNRVVRMLGGRCGRNGSDGTWVVQRWERRGVVDGLAIGEVTGWPAIVRRRSRRCIDLEESIFRKLVAEMIITHVGGEERTIQGGDRMQVDGIPHSSREKRRMFAVGIHAHDRCAKNFAFLTVITR